MTVKNIEKLATRANAQGTGNVQTTSRTTIGFDDEYGINPRPEYLDKASTTFDTYAGGQSLNTYGADIPEDTVMGEDAEYGMNYSHHTPAGHIIEYNDTPGSERIMLRHKSGTGINIGPDGSVMISSKRRVDVINENHYVSVAGDGTMTYEGNLTLNVTGDFNVNVGGEYNVKSSSHNAVVNGSSKRIVYGDDNNTIRGNQSNLVTGGGANTYLEGLNTIVKGESTYVVEGDHKMASSGTLTMTAAKEVVMTSKQANIAADKLSVFGDQGTIGGDNVIMYNYNMYTNEHIITKHLTASARVDTPVVYGDLQGVALQAKTAGTSLHQSYSDGSGTGYSPSTGSNPNYTVTEDTSSIDTTATAKPTSTLLTDYRTKGSKGVLNVVIDPDNILRNSVDLTAKTGGVTDRPLSKQEVRAKMREQSNRDNPEFIAKVVADGLLSPEYIKSSPPNVATIKDTSSIVVQGQTVIGSVSPEMTSKRIKGA